MEKSYSKNIFINCPFDAAYSPIFYGVVFTVFDCGYIARCAREIEDSSEVRIDKIIKIISMCKYGIHDISRTELDLETNLPRFNMPLELGLFLGAKRFGNIKQKSKVSLVMDKNPYRYQSFISDIAGQDIQAHNNQVSEAIRLVREWLNIASKGVIIPGGKRILDRYCTFTSKLPGLCESVGLTVDEMIFYDFINIVSEWLKENPHFPVKTENRD